MASSASEDDRPSGAPVDPSATAAPAAPQTHAEWAASMQAYYAAAGHTYAWPPTQHLMAAAGAGVYGAPVLFPVYHPAYYAHASMAASMPHMAGEAVATATAMAEGKSKRKSSGSPSGEDSSGSGDGGSEESSEERDADADQKGSSSAKRRKSSDANAEGEPSQAATVQNAAAESPFAARGRSASKLSVSATGREAFPNATPNLNIGMDLWSNSPSTAMPSGQGEVNAGAPSQRNGALSQMGERELKRERRKQSNRESARRSRLRKQQECEELAQKVTDLTAINCTLRSELGQLKKDCEDMEAENSQLMDEMVHSESEGPSVLTTLSIQIDTSKAHHGGNGQLNKHRNNDSKG